MTPTLVLVHGCGTGPHFWDDLRREIDVPTLAVALPGRPPTGGEASTSAHEAALRLRDTIASAGVRAIVVGHSFGGGIAIEYALLGAPELCGLGLVATGARLRVLPTILELTTTAARTGEPVDLAAYAFRPDTDPAVVERMRALDSAVPTATTARDWYACNGFDRIRDLDRISVPTLVVAGTDDLLTPPRYAEYLAEHIANARVELVPGAGHMLPVEHAPALAAALRRFYSELSGAPPDAAS